MRGAEVLMEAITQYSALMVMEKEYGRDKMRKFLRYEMDGYLRGRGSEFVAERPLVETEQQEECDVRRERRVAPASACHPHSPNSNCE
jgi:hypothetical protein